MVDDLVRLYNFGGGAPEAEGGEEGAAAAGGADGAPGRPKTRKQVCGRWGALVVGTC
jgi:hypothetical protein